MYRNTRFSDVMKGLSRGEFEQVVRDFKGDKHSKGFRCWDQFTALVYAQLSGCTSLRELEASFNTQSVYHYHLGIRTIKRSTLAQANEKRSSEVYETLCRRLMGRVHTKARRELDELLYLLDSTPITLKGRGYDEWTLNNHNHRTQGLKVHVQVAPDARAPVYVDISAPNVNDIEVGRRLTLERDATYVFDKGYYDYNWWYEIQCVGAKFVTRLKKNAGVDIVKTQPIDEASRASILEDTTITFKNKHPGGQRINDYHGTPLRRIVVQRPNHKPPLVLVTNDFERTAQQLADLYKRRWEIELFFKWIKQNLKIKRFLGRSANAVKIQIYVAIITYLLVMMYRRMLGSSQSLKLCLTALRSTLFQRPEIEQTQHRQRRLRRLEYEQIQGALVFA